MFSTPTRRRIVCLALLSHWFLPLHLTQAFLLPGLDVSLLKERRRGIVLDASATTDSSTLEDRTVKQLWQILEDANQVTPGLKSKLRRKQDIIDYISASQHTLPVEQTEHTRLEALVENKEVENDEDEEENADAMLEGIHSDISEKIPSFLAEKMVRKGIHSLLPIQVDSFARIHDGQDIVLQAPTGSGKTLAYLLPLLSKQETQQPVKNRNQRVATPVILVIVPARELARQVGSEFSKFTPKATDCVTLHGGVPLERHASALRRNQPTVVVGTPGRLRELVREGHLDYSQLSTVVLDEADTLLDKADSPDVLEILREMETAIEQAANRHDNPEYQLLLVSATVNQNIVDFTQEMEIPATNLIRVQGSNSKVLVGSTREEPTEQPSDHHQLVQQTGSTGSTMELVQHWHLACKSSARPSIALDLISILSPRLTIVFVASKAEVEGVASFLSTKLGGSVRVLHGDMVQSARSRSIALIRQAASQNNNPQVLVATDVASRGIDLQVDLVLQFGVPRIAGKEGTFSTELYTHRTGRTGRFNASNRAQPGNAITLYDPAQGEGKLITALAEEVRSELDIDMLPRFLPSAAEVVSSGYGRVKDSILLGDATPAKNELVRYFREKVQEDVDASDADQLLEYLSRAMARLSKLDPSISPFRPHVSLLTGSESDRTVRLFRNEPLTPPEAMKILKDWGSGKLGRIVICADGSAVLDLPEKRAMKLLQTAEQDLSSKASLELPLTLPTMSTSTTTTTT